MSPRKTAGKAPAKGAAAAAPLDFEKSMADLDALVRRLEGGDLPLEDSLAAFEKGIALVRTLHSRLDAVQMRIDELTGGADGDTLAPMTGPGIDDADEEDDDFEFGDDEDDDTDDDE